MRIFFNRGYSLAPISAAMMRAVPSLETVIAIGAGGPHYPGPTKTLEEPRGSDEEYLNWLREQITSNGIDILVPTQRRALVAGADLPCRVEIPAALTVLQLLDDKYAFAQALRDEPYFLPTRAIGSSAALERALASAEFSNPCIKPRAGVNGLGFWKLKPTSATAHLDNPAAHEIRPDQLVAAFRIHEQEGRAPDLVLMDYLPGPEVSFDVLAHRGRLLKYAARTKLPGNIQRIDSHHPLEAAVAALVFRFALHGVINCQFRRAADGTWKLLEINARPAGGSTHSEQVGAGVLGDWARILVGALDPAEVVRPRIHTKLALRTVFEELPMEMAA
jgi:hypothetical protein